MPEKYAANEFKANFPSRACLNMILKICIYELKGISLPGYAHKTIMHVSEMEISLCEEYYEPDRMFKKLSLLMTIYLIWKDGS